MKVWLILCVFGLLMFVLFGYVFGKWFGFGEDLLVGVFCEWSCWMMLLYYFFDDLMFGVVECFLK